MKDFLFDYIDIENYIIERFNAGYYLYEHGSNIEFYLDLNDVRNATMSKRYSVMTDKAFSKEYLTFSINFPRASGSTTMCVNVMERIKKEITKQPKIYFLVNSNASKNLMINEYNVLEHVDVITHDDTSFYYNKNFRGKDRKSPIFLIIDNSVNRQNSRGIIDFFRSNINNKLMILDCSYD